MLAESAIFSRQRFGAMNEGYQRYHACTPAVFHLGGNDQRNSPEEVTIGIPPMVRCSNDTPVRSYIGLSALHLWRKPLEDPTP